jgi:hypothetical protein
MASVFDAETQGLYRGTDGRCARLVAADAKVLKFAATAKEYAIS